MTLRRALVPVVLVLAVMAGCAKKPLTASTAAPAPTPPPATARKAEPAPQPAKLADGKSATAAKSTAPAAAATRPSPKEYDSIAALKDVHFAFDKSDIRSADATVLDANAQWMKNNPQFLILIEGHCDERGTSEYNLALGERRAKSTSNYLVSHGIAASRITLVSYGEEKPQCTAKAEDCWSKNRRAHFLVKPQ